MKISTGAIFLIATLPVCIVFAGPIHEAVLLSDIEAVDRLIESGVDLNQSDYVTGTPLHIAVGQGNVYVIKRLIKAGSDLDTPGENQGMTPLHIAAFFGDMPVIELLLEGGASTESVDNIDETPIYAAIKNDKLKAVKSLIEKGANANAVSESINSSPLHYAVYLGRSDIARMLAEAGADFKYVDNQQRSLLDKAVALKSTSTVGDTSLIRWVADNGGGDPAKTLKWRKAKSGFTTDEVLRLLEDLVDE